MTRKEIKIALAEINKPGSDLNKKYINWCNMRMTNMVADILQHLSNPDQTITTVPAVDGNSACTMVGYISGRSHSAADMVGLDQLQPPEPVNIEETYTEGEV